MKAPQTDPTVQHILGRWCFSVASVGFIERKLASVIFATPPESSFEEALPYFLKHEELLKVRILCFYVLSFLKDAFKTRRATECFATRFTLVTRT